jgi:ATP-binding cassette subfamily C (CFTR/MRP) protein 1
MVTTGILLTLIQVIPTFAMVITFIVYSSTGNPLTLSVIIPSLALFYGLRVPMLFVPFAISLSLDAWVGLQRIGEFLEAEEISDQPKMITFDSSENKGIHVKNGNFEWSGQADNTTSTSKLSNINVSIPRGSLVAVCGTVGAGKSSLLAALIGDMKKTSGEVFLNGSVAYCQQQAWIMNSSLQENIIFGQHYDEKKFEQVLRDCSLERDISILQGGSSAEIGENGINLSGGQKQRLSIARAVYSDSDIYLLDDPLSAVDAHVGKALFENCIKGALKSKTRILVTHQLHFLDQVDSIIVMDESKIIGFGTFTDLLSSCPQFSTMMASHSGDVDKDLGQQQIAVNVVKEASVGKEGEDKRKQKALDRKPTTLIAAEERATGGIASSVYLDYIFHLGGGLTIFLLAFFLVGTNSSRILTDQWLIWWSTTRFEDLTFSQYIGAYIGLTVAQSILGIIFGFLNSFYGARAARQIHNEALAKIYSAPVSFFDSTPLGRITSRFSRDIDTLDTMLPESIRAFIYTFIMCLANLVLISFYLPAFLGAFAIALIAYYFLQVKYRSTARELRRIDSLTRSPVIAMISESLQGLSAIRSYRAVGRFVSRYMGFVDENNRAQYLVILSQRWVQLRLDSLNTVLVFMAGLIAVIFRDKMNQGMSGLIIAYALQVTTTATWCVKTGTDMETFFNSAERLLHYTNNVISEAPDVIEGNRTPPGWPLLGEIRMENINMRYRSDLPLVLKNLSFHFNPAEKIGIVGRTGAGKSTILTALLRLTEYESGSIIIDGIDVAKIGLDDLRSNIAIIPQEPVLFSGTLRFNLDPFSQYEDNELWDVLRRSNLHEVLEKMPNGLESQVSEGGENWSVGQRQLICLARAMLRKSKIILLDEATASVDFETDEYIQRAIRNDFKDSTVITIAHRLNTIADYDRVVVMSFGEILEFDTPYKLLENQNSSFSGMVQETGPHNASVIKQLARNATTL